MMGTRYSMEFQPQQTQTGDFYQTHGISSQPERHRRNLTTFTSNAKNFDK